MHPILLIAHVNKKVEPKDYDFVMFEMNKVVYFTINTWYARAPVLYASSLHSPNRGIPRANDILSGPSPTRAPRPAGTLRKAAGTFAMRPLELCAHPLELCARARWNFHLAQEAAGTFASRRKLLGLSAQARWNYSPSATSWTSI